MSKKINEKAADLLHAVSGKSSEHHTTLAIIAAAGSSSRMGGLDKLALDLDGMPVLVHTLKAYEAAETIDAIYIVTREDLIGDVEELIREWRIHKVERVISGGKTRQESVRNAVDEVGRRGDEKRFKYVAVADGARCLTTPEQIDLVVRTAYTYGAASAATPAVDTIKIADKNRCIESTPDRAFVYQAQTPQVAKYALYMAATYCAEKDGFECTDDNSLIEHVSHPVKLVDCGRENIKITTPVDILIAKAILDARKETPCE